MPCVLAGVFQVVIIPFVAQRLIPMVLSTMVIPQLQFLDKVIDVSVVRVVQVRRSRSHAFVCNDRCPGHVPHLQLSTRSSTPLSWRRVRPPMVLADHRDSPVAVHTVVDVPVALVVQVPQLPLVRRQSLSHSCSC